MEFLTLNARGTKTLMDVEIDAKRGCNFWVTLRDSLKYQALS